MRGVDGTLLALCIVASVGEVLYWLAYNAYFAALGDPEHRGHQIGAREALVAAVGIFAPLVGAWALVTVGSRATFAAVGLVQALAAAPLLAVPNVRVSPAVPGGFRAARSAVLILAVDGWFDACFFFVWQIALFLALGESIPAYGGAMALAGLAGAACALVLGRHVDAGHGRRVVAIAYSVATGLVVLRAASLGSPWLAVTANALGALLMPLLLPALATATYNLAKASPCPFRFQMATEAGWDIGCATACLLAAAISALGVSLSVSVLLALPAIATGAFLLRRQYPRIEANEASGLKRA